jgi:hypothetical protein
MRGFGDEYRGDVVQAETREGRKFDVTATRTMVKPAA